MMTRTEKCIKNDDEFDAINEAFKSWAHSFTSGAAFQLLVDGYCDAFLAGFELGKAKQLKRGKTRSRKRKG